jgi:hypothetical protein
MRLGEPHKKQIKINYKAQFITYSMLNDEIKKIKKHTKNHPSQPNKLVT